MKRLLTAITLVAFMMAAPFALAAEKPQINCCIKGKCEKMTKTDCRKAKGKIVKDCKYCK